MNVFDMCFFSTYKVCLDFDSGKIIHNQHTKLSTKWSPVHVVAMFSSALPCLSRACAFAVRY